MNYVTQILAECGYSQVMPGLKLFGHKYGRHDMAWITIFSSSSFLLERKSKSYEKILYSLCELQAELQALNW